MPKRKYTKNQNTTVTSVRMPNELIERIHDLSAKNLISFNAWVVLALQQKAFKHSNHRFPTSTTLRAEFLNHSESQEVKHNAKSKDNIQV